MPGWACPSILETTATGTPLASAREAAMRLEQSRQPQILVKSRLVPRRLDPRRVTLRWLCCRPVLLAQIGCSGESCPSLRASSSRASRSASAVSVNGTTLGSDAVFGGPSVPCFVHWRATEIVPRPSSRPTSSARAVHRAVRRSRWRTRGSHVRTLRVRVVSDPLRAPEQIGDRLLGEDHHVPLGDLRGLEVRERVVGDQAIGATPTGRPAGTA